MDDGLTLESLKFLMVGRKVAMDWKVRPCSVEGRRSGYAIHFQVRSPGFGNRTKGWLLAEKSKQVRVFAKAETAFDVLRSLGVDFFIVDFRPESQGIIYPRSMKY